MDYLEIERVAGSGARTTAEAGAGLVASSLEMKAWPNPFEAGVQVEFVARETGEARLEVYDVRGQRVRTLFAGSVQAGEVRRVAVEGRDLSQGLYVLRLRNGSQSSHLKLVHGR